MQRPGCFIFYCRFSKSHEKSTPKIGVLFKARTRFELVITVLQTIALPLGYRAKTEADYGARTRYLHLGKVALYQMS